MAIRVRCKCGKALKIPSQLAGKKVSCPGCQKAFRIPIEKFQAAEARARGVVNQAQTSNLVATPPPLDDPANTPSELDLLGDVGLSTSDVFSDVGSMTEGPPIDSKSCPSCAAPMASAARLCTACGFDTVKGKAVKGAGGGAVSMAKGLAKATGGFALGVLLSAVGAALGGGVWFLIGWYLGREVGYVAWGVGILAGFGMVIAGQDGTTRAGVTAAGLAAISLIGAKVAIFFFLVLAFVTGDSSSPEMKRQLVIVELTEEILDHRGLKTEKARMDRWDEAEEEARLKVKTLSASEFDAKLAAHQERMQRELEESEDSGSIAEAGETREGPSGAQESSSNSERVDSVPTPSFFAMFFQSMFKPLDFLFFFLALASAYRLGRQGVTLTT